MLAGLARYDATTHFLGQSTTIEVDRAIGETYCRRDGRWFFEDRSLIVDWIEYRPMAGPGIAPPWARRVDESYVTPR